jgi:DNA mismatch endonuclease (patch repair protein)
MADVFSKQKRSEIMSLIRSKNTKPEIALRKLVSAAFYPKGYRYRIHYKKLKGRPDIAFVSLKVAVFMDGAFWHGYQFEKRKKKLPKKYWVPKIEENMRRDRRTNARLKKLGWKVVRVWGHDVKKKPDRVIERIAAALKASK